MGRPPNVPDPGDSPLHLFASEHRRYRKNAGITQAELAAEITFTPQFVGKVEVAARTPSRQYVDSADRVLQAEGALISIWTLVSRMHIPKWFGPFLQIEGKATSKREWECAVIPGLLQTSNYATALAHADRPYATNEQIEHEVDVRMQRQDLLHKGDPLTLWTVIDEYIFYRTIGSPSIMREQYEHLLKMSELPHVVIQILPFDAGGHPGQQGAFEILELEDQPEIAWLEGPSDGHFIDQEEKVAECIRRYDHLRAMALSPAASRTMITTYLEKLCKPPTRTSSPGASPRTAEVKAEPA